MGRKKRHYNRTKVIINGTIHKVKSCKGRPETACGIPVNKDFRWISGGDINCSKCKVLIQY